MDLCPEGFDLSFEGLARICIPKQELYRRDDNVYEPSWAPVFYNPQMIENRDIAVGVVRYIARRLDRELVVVDPLAATGVRGIRISLEVSNANMLRVFMSDISDSAVNVMKVNVKLNRVEEHVAVEKADANEYLYRLRRSRVKIDYIDIDPFGTPVPFLFSAISNIGNGGIVAATATDLAVLTGKYANKLYQRYGVIGAALPASRDIAVRVLLSYIARISHSLDKYIEPIISYAYKHYVRIYVVIRSGATNANQQLNSCLKTVGICSHCGYMCVDEVTNGVYAKNMECPLCRTHLTIWSPLWMCNTVDKNTIEGILRDLDEIIWVRKSSKKLLQMLHSYAHIDAITIRLTQIARYLHINTPPRSKVIQCLENLGYRAVESYSYPDGIVTDAHINDLAVCCKS